MYKQLPGRIILLFLLFLFVVSGFLYYPRYQNKKAKEAELAAILSGPNKILSLDSRTKLADCLYRGALPDHACTPGDVFFDATTEQICVSRYSQSARKVSQKMRKKVFAEYGVQYPQPRGAFEVDHLIPLALGGSNEIANLWLQPAEPMPGFREKDIVEIYLHEEVCAGRVALSVAQEEIVNNWPAIYNNLSPQQIEQIKTKFRNWSN